MPREPRTHELKIWPSHFEEVASGRKPFEVRKLDRDYQVGDTLLLEEWDLKLLHEEANSNGYTGRVIRAEVTYILLLGWLVTKNPLVVMAIKPGPIEGEALDAA